MSCEEKCDNPNTCICTIMNGKVIASGGFGKVLKYKNKAIKMIRKITSCSEAKKEYENILTIHEAFQKACKKRDISVNIHKALNRLKPLKPYFYWQQSFSYQEEAFSCAILSKFIKGIPLRDLIKLDKSSKKYNMEEVDNFKSVLTTIHMSAPYSKLSLMDDSEPLSIFNPPRYFILTLEDAKKLYKDIHNFDSKYGYWFQMGVMMSVMTFLAKIILIDAEILFGIDDKIHILDFGMCKKIEEKSTVEEIAENMLDIGGPFFTKDSIPNKPNMENWSYFRHGFIKTAKDFEQSEEIATNIIELIEKDLKLYM
jgi:serine/threonine protein kinase